ncbi:MAG: peptidase, partial [Acidobacteria bacterium]|nr:peptidase [Acidobacteriota bacterium]
MQPPASTRGTTARIEKWLSDPGLKAALAGAAAAEAAVIEDQIAFTEIPAPPFKEQERAARLKRTFEELGLRRVRLDAAGNVIGERPG